jgi:hypothetical protein
MQGSDHVRVLTIVVSPAEGEPVSDADRAATGLSRLLSELPVDYVTRPSGPPQVEGAKSGFAQIGAILVGVLPKALPVVLGTLERWLRQNSRHTLKIQAGDVVFELSGRASPEDAARLLDRVLKHAAESVDKPRG